MIHERWVHVGRDADGEVYVSEGVDLEGMREVRLGDGRRQRFRPDGPTPWLDTLTHWAVSRSKVTYVTEEGKPAPPPRQRLSGYSEGGVIGGPITVHVQVGEQLHMPDGSVRQLAADGTWQRVQAGSTPALAYPRRNIQWSGSEETVVWRHNFSTAPGDDDDD